MLYGSPVSATLTTMQSGDPAVYVSVRNDADGYVYSSTFTLTSEAARELTKKVLTYLGYDSSTDKDFAKLLSGEGSVDTGKTIEFDIKEQVGKDGKTYKNVTFPTLNSVSGKPKTMLTKETGAILIATHNLKDFFGSIKADKIEVMPF